MAEELLYEAYCGSPTIVWLRLGFGGGGLLYETVGDNRRKVLIKPPRETNTVWAWPHQPLYRKGARPDRPGLIEPNTKINAVFKINHCFFK